MVTYRGVEIEECSAHENLGRGAYQAPINQRVYVLTEKLKMPPCSYLPCTYLHCLLRNVILAQGFFVLCFFLSNTTRVPYSAKL